MKEELLFKICLTGSLVGILTIVVISSIIDLNVVTPIHVNETENSEFVLNGLVESVKETDKYANIEMYEIRKVKTNAIYFKRENSSIGLQKGENVSLVVNKFNDRLIVQEINYD